MRIIPRKLAVLILRRHWPLLLVIVAVLAFKGLVHVFIGLSRYRLGWNLC